MVDTIERRSKAAIDAGKINGAIICATDVEGHFVYNTALGQRTLLTGEKRPQKLDDVLCMASATALITTIAALQCVEQGLLTLTGDLSFIAPELTAKHVITGYSGDVPQFEALSGHVSLEMLLTHSSGQGYYFLNPNVSRWCNQSASVTEDGDKRQPVETASDYPFSFQPGTGWMYGPGLDWAGHIVERVTGHTLGEYMHQHIFKPLDISDAAFYPVTRGDLQDRLVDLNPQDPECFGSAILGGGGTMNRDTKGDFGAHGLFMTGTDYVKVLHSLLSNDGKILQPLTVDNMFSNHLNPKAAVGYQEVLSGPMGAFFRVDADVEKQPDMGHGLGGMLTLEDINGGYGEHTLTWGGSMTLVWFIDRKNGLCGVGAIQPSLPIGGSDRILGLKQTIYRGIYEKYAAWKQQ